VFDIFTDLARRAVTLSQDEAISLGHDFIGTEHVLLGLSRVSEGIAGQVLTGHGVTPERVRPEVVRLLAADGITGSGGAPATDALAAIGIDVDEIRRRAEDAFGPGQFFFPRPAYTFRAKAVLEQSLLEARALGHDYVGTEHVLLGLLAEGASTGTGVGFRAIRGLDVDPGSLRPAVLDLVAARAS
jgi:ATP-dependent Clp protease ATP-binding subunit ClpC